MGLKCCATIKCVLQLWDLPRDDRGVGEEQESGLRSSVFTQHRQARPTLIPRAGRELKGGAFINCAPGSTLA